jgi:hypothetical protein
MPRTNKPAETLDKGVLYVKATKEFRLDGDAIPVGHVLSVSEFANKSDYLNLLNMEPPRLEVATSEQYELFTSPPKKKPASKNQNADQDTVLP